jgi:predicted DCC family thiol-disulfide oxidoreductase YuxK
MASSPAGLIVLFDGGCPVCRRSVRTLRALDWLDRLQFGNAMDPATRGRVAPDLTEADVMREMFVIDAAGRRYPGYDAYLQIASVVPVLWPFRILGALPGIRQIGQAVYRVIAANRRRRGVCTDDLCSPAFRRGGG